MATHECVSEVAWHTEENHIHTTQSQHCTESLLWELPVEHSRCHKDAGLLLRPSPFLELSGKLYPDTARTGLPASGPCLGWVYVSHLRLLAEYRAVLDTKLGTVEILIEVASVRWYLRLLSSSESG